MKSPKLSIVTLGCPKNDVDSEVLRSQFKSLNYELIQNVEHADIIVVNTCGFIEAAKEESIETTLELAQLKKDGNCKAIIMTGCLAQRYESDLPQLMPEVDVVIGNRDLTAVPKIADKLLGIDRTYAMTESVTMGISHRIAEAPHAAYIKVSEGCNHKCTYCIIPAIRGRYRSFTIPQITAEVSQLAECGVKEIYLIAQDLTMYGKDIYGSYELLNLLQNLAGIDGIRWIRLMYNYPMHITDDLLHFITDHSEKFNYFDMPLQHIHDDMLRAMQRPVNSRTARKILYRLREKAPHMALRTTFITGFPGETDDHFESLCDFLEEIKFDRVGVFTFSEEEGTPAATYRDQIPHEIAIQRRNTLMEIQQAISMEHNEALIGTELDILVDSCDQFGTLGRSYRDAYEIDGNVEIEGVATPGEFI
ncbi:MAG: 30S ribosomal protein S12 methylthiotransferase RimO, partial [Gemmatimonadetes bacterium]